MTSQETDSLAREIYDAFMTARKTRDADACRTTLRALKTEHGSVAFETAKVKALAFDARVNG